jgi:hypothetical protein
VRLKVDWTAGADGADAPPAAEEWNALADIARAHQGALAGPGGNAAEPSFTVVLKVRAEQPPAEAAESSPWITP